MKPQTIILFALVITSFIAGCGTSGVNNEAKIKFEVTEFDFGKLEFKGKGDYQFKFTNPGNTPLVIQHVKTSCGCTVPEWSKKPIKPGRGGAILINYDTSHPGVFNKTITVFYNGQDSPKTLIIKGNVGYPGSTAIKTE